ncbi:MAG TPA: hypothetical protein VIG33_07015 [Pseudobdellovibrionaceae bacterium]|jgi:hypothetical protein
MRGIFKKSLIKWSAIASLGISAYFLGYFWGVKNLGSEAKSPMSASEVSDRAADLSKLKERVR